MSLNFMVKRDKLEGVYVKHYNQRGAMPLLTVYWRKMIFKDGEQRIVARSNDWWQLPVPVKAPQEIQYAGPHEGAGPLPVRDKTTERVSDEQSAS